MTKEITSNQHERTLITSALPYVHDLPHLGNIVGSVLPADVLHRYLQLKGENVLAICGSDEHGTPAEVKAVQEGRDPAALAEENHQRMKDLLERFHIQFSHYGRTHTEANQEETYAILERLYNNGYITEREEQQLYCTYDKRFLADRYIEGTCPQCEGLARGDQCDDCGELLDPKDVRGPWCTICGGKQLELRNTRHLYLQLQKFEQQLKEWLTTQQPLPDTKQQEVLNFIEQGLHERPITRDINWGFPVPYERLGLDPNIYKDKVIYVWFDAPIGYIGITKDYWQEQGQPEEWLRWWKDTGTRTIYSMGKDNVIFHSILFPAYLIGANDGHVLPYYEMIHEYLISKDVKFSKSRGEGLTSEQALELLPADYWRFYLMSALPVGHDTTFTWHDLETKINTELNDNIGNFIHRVMTLAEKWFDSTVPKASIEQAENQDHQNALEEAQTLFEQYQQHFEQYELKKALGTALDIARHGNRYLAEQEPWRQKDNRAEVIYTCLNIVKTLSMTLWPFIPQSAETIWRMLNIKPNIADTEPLVSGHQLGEKQQLFHKMTATEVAAAVEAHRDEAPNETHKSVEHGSMHMSTIDFDQFQQLDLRVGTIQNVREHGNADKLYVMQIDIGEETKQTCAGLRPHFSPEELTGRKVVTVANLEPSALRGETSECMVLAADNDGSVTLVDPGNVPNGTRIR